MKTRIIGKVYIALFCGWFGLLAPVLGAEPAAAARTVRTIDSANPEPPLYSWHPHNRLGIERGAFAGVKDFNRLLLREESGDVLEVPFFHFTARDLGEIMNRMAEFPPETRVVEYATPSAAPIVDLRPAELAPGPLRKWPNRGVLGGDFCSMNVPPTVEDIQGRRAVHFDCNQWFYDTRYNAMVLDAMPAAALKEDMPFTFTAWVLHPKEPDGDDCEMLMSWHARGGNNGVGLDWKRSTCRGDFFVMGLGGDLWVEPHNAPKPMPEWTHVAYVYTGGGIRGELVIYENGRPSAVGRSPFVPELRDPVQITSDAVVLKGFLHTLDPEQRAYVRGYIGEYDAHHFGQLRHIGRWEQMNEIGLKLAGEFEIPFKDLKPGTRYYYRMFATEDPTSYENPGEKTRRWANGAGSFITAGADGTPGRMLPLDTDRFLFLGTQWGSRWYSSFSGPAGHFRGYFGDVKLYDRALTEDEVRRDARATAVYDGSPADKSDVDVDTADFTWKRGVVETKRFRFYLDTDRAKVINGTAATREVETEKIEGVKLLPGQTFHWRVDSLGADGRVLAQGNVWTFHVTFGEPATPAPAPGSRTSATGFFSWSQPLSTIKEQRLYYGTEAEAVSNGTAEVIQLDGNRRDCFAPNQSIRPGAIWYWRLETRYADDRVAPGPVWAFQALDYCTPEFDGPVSEPYPADLNPSRPSKLMEGLGHPTISTPNADEATLRNVAHATKRYLRKSLQLRNHLASWPCATTLSSPEGPPCVDGFNCGSYGGMPGWFLTMHEMGHQVLMNGMGPMSPDFYTRLTEVFNAHADNNAWLGDYAAVNIHENIAVNGHGFISGKQREALLQDDAPTYHLLSQYLPGDLAVELHPAFGLTLDGTNRVLAWRNRGGIEDWLPGHQAYEPMPETVGMFGAAGGPVLKTVQGAAAVLFGGADALVWDRELTYGFSGNRAWSVELWARREAPEQEGGLLLGWGPEDKGASFYWGGGGKAWRLSGQAADWPAQPPSAQWHHLVFLFEGGGLRDTAGAMRLFLNGREILNRPYKLDLAPKGLLQIGGRVSEGKVEQGFSGAIAHVRVYNYALSVEQVAEHYTTERHGYERTPPAAAGGSLYVDLDALQLEETGAEEHRPLYPESLCKPWVRSWANKGILSGRMHNDVGGAWHYSGSAPLYGDVQGIRAVRFAGKDRMVSVLNLQGAITRQGGGTLEAVVFVEANAPENVVLEWGGLALETRLLKPGWQHVAVNAAGGKSLLFVDGREVGDIPGVLRPGAWDRLHLGGHYDVRRGSWGRFFSGALAQVRIHEAALTPEQIAAHARQSPVGAPHQPVPADGARVVVARKPALGWLPGADATEKETVRLGTDPARLEPAGTFGPGEFRPDLAGGTRYFWQVGGGPVWSFATTEGELVTLQAGNLKPGPLDAWTNTGAAGGTFVPADRGNLLGMDVVSFNGGKGLRLVQGKALTFRPGQASAEALARGPYTIVLRVASDNATESVPVLSWGAPEAPALLWFGTFASDRRLLTLGGLRPSQEACPPEQLRMIYPETCNARMAFVWKTLTVTYEDGEAELWYNRRCADTRKVDLRTDAPGDVTLGWNTPRINGNILVGDLRVYGRGLKEADIGRLADGRTIEGAAPLLRVSAAELEPGTRLAVLKNGGSLEGCFTAAPEVDRKPAVREVNGRRSVAFDGVAMLTSDFVLPEALADARPFTVEILALQDEPSNRSRLLAFSQEISERYTSFAMGSSAHAGAIVRPFSGAEWRLRPEEKPGQWVHMAYVYDGGMHSLIRLYRDGVLNAEYGFRTVDTIGGYPLSLGGIMSPSVAEKDLFKGAIAEVRVFDYARTAAEIAEASRRFRK